MARYIDADELLRDIYRNPEEDSGERCAQILEAILSAHTADVAPMAEVAREIFWEMDKLLLSITIDEEAEESFVGFDFDKYIALKKKYTQSEPTEGD